MFDSLLSSVISIDGDFETIHFYSVNKDNKAQKSEDKSASEKGGATPVKVIRTEVKHDVEIYKAKAFSDEFFTTLKNLVKLHYENAKANHKVALVLPDSLFFTDTIKVPVMKKRALTTSLGVAFDAIYKNSRELRYKTYPLLQNKNAATFGVIGLRKDFYNKTVSAIEEEGVSVAVTTFSASAMVRGATAINNKLKGSSYILVDVKENSTHFAYVLSGKTVGFYTLPFGFSSFKEDEVNIEASLFDHHSADLLILNAKEKAKKKQLTVEVDEDEFDDDDFDEEGDTASDEEVENKPKQKANVLNKRMNKKYPKFMLRPEPTDVEGFIYENFRPIVKWTLELIRNNPELALVESIKNVYVNMPAKYLSVFDKVKQEVEDVNFLPVFNGEIKSDVALNLELYGGLYLKKSNKINNV